MISQEALVTTKGTDVRVGVLFSGGLDSAILTAHLLTQGFVVQPFYIRCDLVWEPCERSAASDFLAAIQSPRLRELVDLELPLTDLYEDHWSVTGQSVPGADSSDQAVFLPGRNALLIVKAAVWCQVHGFEKLALAPLGTSPFADASREFFDRFEYALNIGDGPKVEVLCPFDGMNKRDVMQLGQEYPLELSFSCISPRDSLHCGCCNKCAERQAAFRSAGLRDPTSYAAVPTLLAQNG